MIMQTSLVPSSSVFNFNAEHNGVECIESTRPEDRGSENQFWFTAKMLSESFQCKVDTIKARVESLIATGDLDDTKNLVSSKMPYSNGSLHDVMLYNLTVFNKIGMTFIDNSKAVEIRSKFNDILVKEETGKEKKESKLTSLAKKDQDQENALILAIVNSDDKVDCALALREFKSFVTRTERKRAFASMQTASVEKRKSNKLTAENSELKEQNASLVQENKELRDENQKIKRSCGCNGSRKVWFTISEMKIVWEREFSKEPKWQELKEIIDCYNLLSPVKDVEEFVNGRRVSVNRYPRRAWEIYYKLENNKRNLIHLTSISE